MSLIVSVKTYLTGYSGLEDGAPLWVDYLGSEPTGYAIIPLPGTKIIEKYLDGGSLREFPFAFQSMELTADEAERLENNGFFEALSDWFEDQSALGDLPALGEGKSPRRIEALGWAFVYETSESETAVYRIQCKLTYEQDPQS
jgi:hypothetical protein